jgi:hypothetical protein
MPTCWQRIEPVRTATRCLTTRCCAASTTSTTSASRPRSRSVTSARKYSSQVQGDRTLETKCFSICKKSLRNLRFRVNVWDYCENGCKNMQISCQRQGCGSVPYSEAHNAAFSKNCPSFLYNCDQCHNCFKRQVLSS